jgi:GTPase SAR1 family protein
MEIHETNRLVKPMDQFLEKNYDRDLRSLFKRDTKVDSKNLAKILDLPVEKLLGIESLKEKLNAAEIYSVYDLSQTIPEEVKVEDLDITTLKKWIRKAKIIVNYVQNPLTKKKMLLAGLDFAGKTSLLSVLKKDYGILQELLPTKGAQRDGVEFFGISIITWDLGGQALYRKDYLDEKKSKLFFSETDVIFFVIDVQDEKRYPEALDYYEQTLQAYANLGERPSIVVLFNKMDPKLKDYNGVLERIAQLEVDIANISTSYDFSCVFANTSIFDKNSVFQAFSLGIRSISQTAELVSSLLEEYCIRTNGKAAILLSSEGEVFAQTGVSKEYIDLATQNGMLVDAMLRYNVGKGMKLEKNPVFKFTDNEIYLIGQHVSSSPVRNVFLWLLVENLIDFTSALKFFKTEVEPLLNLFII